MPQSSSSNINIEIASSWEAVADRWKALEKDAGATPFQSAHWIGNWYATFAPAGNEPVIVVIKERTSGRDLMMIPLVRRTERSVRHIEFADLWVTDYNAPLIRSDYDFGSKFQTEIWPKILAVLPPADVLILRKMPTLLGSIVNPLAKLAGAEASDLSGHIVDLGDSWDQYQASLSKSARRELRRRAAKFTNEQNGSLRRITNSEEAFAALRVLQQQQTSRLASRGAKHVFDDPLYQELYRSHLRRGLESGAAVMFVLTAGSEIVATFLALNHKNHCTLVRMSQSHGDAWKPLGLGKMIIHQALEALHAEGCRTFDLSVGSNRYKEEFGVSPVPMAELTAQLSWRGATFVARKNTVAYISRRPMLMAIARSIADRLPRRQTP